LGLQGDKTRAKENSQNLSKTSTDLGAEIKEEKVVTFTIRHRNRGKKYYSLQR